MKKCSLFLTSALCALLFAGAAYADNGCPEGTTALINLQTNTRSCIPVAPNAQGTAPVAIERVAVSDPAANDEGQSATPVATDGAEPKDAAPVAHAATDAAAPEDAAPVAHAAAKDSTSTLDANGPIKDQIRAAQIAELAQRKNKARIAQIAESVRTGGWVLGGGVGFGYTKSFDLCRVVLHVMTGYHFAIPSSDLLSFGLYLDAFVQFVGLVSGDVFVTPNLHISSGRFRFSIGLGLGTSIMSKLMDTNSPNNDADEYTLDDITFDNSRKETDAYFTLAPTLGFDWFLTQKAFFGIGAVVPLMIDSDGVNAGLKFDLHVGYKF